MMEPDTQEHVMTRFRMHFVFLVLVAVAGCAGLSQHDPLYIDVAGIEPVPGEGMELVLGVRVRVQNPNDSPVEYNGVALALEINDRRLASGVSNEVGTVPRYGEIVFTIPVTISAFNVARQIYGAMNTDDPNEVRYSVRGKLEGGLFGTRRFSDEGTFTLAPREQATQY
jgi:LEA14-like dessication related protein